MERISLLILIPAYNEEKKIFPLLEKVKKFTSASMCVVDDGSIDKTFEQASKADVHIISHEQNLGKGMSILSGFQYFLSEPTFSHVLIMDGDAQHDPEEIGKFIDICNRTQSDLIIGNRMNDPKIMPFDRKWTNIITSKIISFLSKRKVHDSQCGFRMLSRSLIEKLDLSTSRFELESEMIIQAGRMGFSVSEVPIKIIYDDETSSIKPIPDTINFIKLVWKYLFK